MLINCFPLENTSVKNIDGEQGMHSNGCTKVIRFRILQKKFFFGMFEQTFPC